jgi:hypothetical protein
VTARGFSEKLEKEEELEENDGRNGGALRDRRPGSHRSFLFPPER